MRDELDAVCRARLAAYKIPQHWLFADELPTTPTGKVQKFKLVDAVMRGALTQLP